MNKKKKSTKLMLNKTSIANLDMLENWYIVELPPHVLKNIYAAVSEFTTSLKTLEQNYCDTNLCPTP